MLNAKVLADGDAILLPVPGNVIIILPPLGIAVGFVNLIVWVDVTAEYTVVPEWCVAPIWVVKYKTCWFVLGLSWADSEATVTVLNDCPVSLSKTALSEAKNIGLLFAMGVVKEAIVTCVSVLVESPIIGADADGLEVVIVSEALVSVAAFTVVVKKKPNKRIRLGRSKCFLIISAIYRVLLIIKIISISNI